MGRTEAVAVEMERSQEKIFWSLNNEDLMMGVEAERKKGKNDDCQVSDLSSCVTGGTIYDTEKTG